MHKPEVEVKSSADINLDEVAYAEWSCICAGNSYGETTSCDYDRTYWIPGLVTTPKPPLRPPLCDTHKSWECVLVYVMLEEIGAKEISEFIRKSGGVIGQKEFDRYEDNRLAPLKAKREREYRASEKSSTAKRLEKSDSCEAVSLYRESISISFEAISILPEQFDYRDFPYLFNRLTLLLEKLGRFKEAIEEIKRFEALSCCIAGPKSEIESLSKRRIRLQKKYLLLRDS